MGEGSRGITKPFNKDYVTVHASVRGTGCSGGEFDLFSWRSALDGYELVEWIADQEWSTGEVGIYGHSYGGITGFMVGATQAPAPNGDVRLRVDRRSLPRHDVSRWGQQLRVPPAVDARRPHRL